MTKAAKYLKINVILFLIAAAISAYLLWHHYEIKNGEAAFNSICSVNANVDCDAVSTSMYSEFLGIPLAAWGLGYYLFALILSFTGMRNAFARREATLVLFPFTAVTVLVAGLSVILMTVVIKSLCLFCLGLDIINVLTFFATFLAMRDVTADSTFGAEWKEMRSNRVVTFLGIGVALIGITHLISSQFEKKIPFDEEMFLSQYRSQPVMPVEAGTSPRMGFQGDNPKLQLIEFADYQCPACAMAAKKMHVLLKTYKDQVQVVFKNFPWDSSCNPNIPRGFHPQACGAAKAAYCAHKQNKFEAMYEHLFENQQLLAPESYVKWAQEIGLNEEEFKTCYGSPETLTAIQKDTAEAKAAGVESTPTFFANGKRIEGVIDESRLKVLLKEASN